MRLTSLPPLAVSGWSDRCQRTTLVMGSLPLHFHEALSMRLVAFGAVAKAGGGAVVPRAEHSEASAVDDAAVGCAGQEPSAPRGAGQGSMTGRA